MLKNIYFSAGEYCATAHQIRRYTQNKEAYFFDWLVTRGSSFEFAKQSNDLFLQSMNWKIIDNGIRLLDRYSGLAFQHEFKVHDDEIDPSLVEEHLVTDREKFLYLKQKLIMALKIAQRGVIVRAENEIKSIDQAKTRLEQLKSVFLPINSSLNFVIASTQLYSNEEFTPHYLIVSLGNANLPNSRDAWKGDDQSWDRLFELAEKNFVF